MRTSLLPPCGTLGSCVVRSDPQSPHQAGHCCAKGWAGAPGNEAQHLQAWPRAPTWRGGVTSTICRTHCWGGQVWDRLQGQPGVCSGFTERQGHPGGPSALARLWPHRVSVSQHHRGCRRGQRHLQTCRPGRRGARPRAPTRAQPRCGLCRARAFLRVWVGTSEAHSAGPVVRLALEPVPVLCI